MVFYNIYSIYMQNWRSNMLEADETCQGTFENEVWRQPEHLRIPIKEFTCHMQNTGLCYALMQTHKKTGWLIILYVGKWQTLLKTFQQSVTRHSFNLGNELMMLDTTPVSKDDGGASALASKQLEQSSNKWYECIWRKSVGWQHLDGFAFFQENVGYTKEASISTEQQLARLKQALDNFEQDITKDQSTVKDNDLIFAGESQKPSDKIIMVKLLKNMHSLKQASYTNRWVVECWIKAENNQQMLVHLQGLHHHCLCWWLSFFHFIRQCSEWNESIET